MTDQADEAVSLHPNRSLESIELLSVLPADVVQSFEQQCTWLEFAPGEVVLERGEESNDVHFIVTGAVRVMNYVAEGRDVAFADISAGGFFGEFSAIDSAPRSAQIVCSSRAVIAVLPREAIVAALKDYPDLAFRLIQYLVQVIRRLTSRVGTLVGLAPQQRIYTELLRLAKPSPAADGTWLIEHAPQHNEIASWSGTDRENVSATIGGLIRDGIVRRRNKDLVVCDYARLRVLAEM